MSEVVDWVVLGYLVISVVVMTVGVYWASYARSLKILIVSFLVSGLWFVVLALLIVVFLSRDKEPSEDSSGEERIHI